MCCFRISLGNDSGACVRTIVGLNGAWHCTLTVLLQGGNIIAEGRVIYALFFFYKNTHLCLFFMRHLFVLVPRATYFGLLFVR